MFSKKHGAEYKGDLMKKSKDKNNEIIRVCIVDDEPSVLLTHHRILQKSSLFECTGFFKSGREALNNLLDTDPDVILMDIRMPGISGVECTHRIHAIKPDLIVIMVTAFGDVNACLDSFKAGAAGFLTKPQPIPSYHNAILFAMNGGTPVSRGIAQQLGRLSPSNEIKHIEKILNSSEERQIMRLLSSGLPDKQIASVMNMSINMVRNRLRAIYRKLDVQTRTEAVLAWNDGRATARKRRSQSHN
ncbi:MAG: response regulator transcription factor [Verrucomicrobia bacterium]|nr:response regulator transcription factor [Verrucomicrobiota bacterium]